MDTVTFVRLDGQKATVRVALTESHRGGELCQLSVFENRPEILMNLAARLSKVARWLSSCYEDVASRRAG